MTRLRQLYTQQRQSPWLDNLTRAYLRDGTLADFVAAGDQRVYPLLNAETRIP